MNERFIGTFLRSAAEVVKQHPGAVAKMMDAFADAVADDVSQRECERFERRQDERDEHAQRLAQSREKTKRAEARARAATGTPAMPPGFDKFLETLTGALGRL